ncbi:CDP-alcohol phosphatidyltransferase family protein [Ornithinimicrobium faecis]|uniref:CDP-alcohol phosphatidyltransferase family protein n=1 Tax=Ornithinimicrobium faecis TaxID=2934158 RepID=A0ABY4YZ36_9MICO|nr:MULTISPECIES: CDP-alcohol phosphatidyltransferase family protein [unclassified Ornithinimicrobium]USQ82046.1 CDP-alcohol phosphatidyltransferase family protein [Ornithinimicrobium sp. HY1793]
MSSTDDRGGRAGAVLNVPNVLSSLRLVGVPLFLWAILTDQDVLAVIVLMASGVTDYLDGKIARHFGLVTTLGQYLDPMADRLYIASTLFGLAWREIIPWWLVLAIVARDLFVLSLYPVVRSYDLPVPPVHFIGKAATFNLLCGFPLILLGQFDTWLGAAVLPVGWAFAWWGTGLYALGAALYAWQVGVMVAQRRRQWQAVGA